MKFTKMQGIGNDYVYVNCFEETVADPAAVAVTVSDRHFGVGSDGLILICPSETADFRMRMFNADGSEGSMCGNGIRCLGKYVRDRGLTEKDEITVETLSGIKTLQLLRDGGVTAAVRVDMGAPGLSCSQVPVLHSGERFVDLPLTAGEHTLRFTCVSMGNPHAVTFVEDTASVELEKIGPLFENHPVFPRRANIEFIQRIDDHTIRMRVWERGSGETLACGTGACASVVASALCGVCSREATVKLLGGDLDIRWSEGDDHVYMTGPAAFVFDGEIAL